MRQAVLVIPSPHHLITSSSPAGQLLEQRAQRGVEALRVALVILGEERALAQQLGLGLPEERSALRFGERRPPGVEGGGSGGRLLLLGLLLLAAAACFDRLLLPLLLGQPAGPR